MLFFCDELKTFNSERSAGIDMEGGDDGDEGEESGDKGESEGVEGEIDQSERTYRWLGLIDTVSETKRVSWDDAYEMNVYEFFNIISYAKEKARRKQEDMKKWSMKH